MCRKARLVKVLPLLIVYNHFETAPNCAKDIPQQNKESEPVPNGGISSDFSSMVDDIGLEPMTFRTSSGCSSQLS